MHSICWESKHQVLLQCSVYNICAVLQQLSRQHSMALVVFRNSTSTCWSNKIILSNCHMHSGLSVYKLLQNILLKQTYKSIRVHFQARDHQEYQTALNVVLLTLRRKNKTSIEIKKYNQHNRQKINLYRENILLVEVKQFN